MSLARARAHGARQQRLSRTARAGIRKLELGWAAALGRPFLPGGGAPGARRGRGGAGRGSGCLKEASPAQRELALSSVGGAECWEGAVGAPGIVMSVRCHNLHIRYPGVLIEKLITVVPFRVG